MAPPAARPKVDVLEQFRLAVRIMASRALKDPEAAEEAAQETLVRATEAMREGRPRDPEKLGAFVRGIARHVISDALRAGERNSPIDTAPQGKLSTHRQDSLSALITTEERNRVRLALTQLSTGDREILHLSFFEGLTPREIAKRSGEPSFRISRCRGPCCRRSTYRWA